VTADDLQRHIERIFGQTDEPPDFYRARATDDLFAPYGGDRPGLSHGRRTEVQQLLEARPRKHRFVTEDQLRSVGEAADSTVAESDRALREEERKTLVANRVLYSQVAEGVGSEYGFNRGRPLAEAVGYDEADLAAVPPATLDRFVGLGCPWALGHPAPGDRCLDLGCGVGLDALIAAHHVGASGLVVALDLAPGMVRAVDDAAREVGLTNLVALEASATHLPLADGWADLISANGVLVLFRDLYQILDECHRVLRPGGVLRFADTVFGDEHDRLGTTTDLRYWNRLNHGRPFIEEAVRMLLQGGWTDLRVGAQVDPFVAGMDHNEVWGRSFEARRP
jgi:SAM-dependent methyltransferase